MIEHIFSKQWLLKNSLYTQVVANLTDISLNTVNIIYILYSNIICLITLESVIHF